MKIAIILYKWLVCARCECVLMIIFHSCRGDERMLPVTAKQLNDAAANERDGFPPEISGVRPTTLSAC